MLSKVMSSQSFFPMPISELWPTQTHSWHTELEGWKAPSCPLTFHMCKLRHRELMSFAQKLVNINV